MKFRAKVEKERNKVIDQDNDDYIVTITMRNGIVLEGGARNIVSAGAFYPDEDLIKECEKYGITDDEIQEALENNSDIMEPEDLITIVMQEGIIKEVSGQGLAGKQYRVIDFDSNGDADNLVKIKNGQTGAVHNGFVGFNNNTKASCNYAFVE